MGADPKPTAARKKAMQQAKREQNTKNHPSNAIRVRDVVEACTTESFLANASSMGKKQVMDLLQPLVALLGYPSDGYIKIVPTTDDKSVYLILKYSRGRWKGHYLAVVVARDQLDFGVELLRRKVEDVLAGRKRPSRDRYVDAE